MSLLRCPSASGCAHRWAGDCKQGLALQKQPLVYAKLVGSVVFFLLGTNPGV